jgi:hypothetical protein
MWDMCRDKMAIFTKEVSRNGMDATRVSVDLKSLLFMQNTSAFFVV